MKHLQSNAMMKTLNFLLLISWINAQCLVDNCKTCPNTTDITCTACNSGYYLRTFSGGDKEYNACWRTWKLVLASIGALLSYCLCGLCCYLCRQRGLKDRRRPRVKTATKPLEQESELITTDRPPQKQPVVAKTFTPRKTEPTQVSPPRQVVRQPVPAPVYVPTQSTPQPVRYIRANPPPAPARPIYRQPQPVIRNQPQPVRYQPRAQLRPIVLRTGQPQNPTQPRYSVASPRRVVSPQASPRRVVSPQASPRRVVSPQPIPRSPVRVVRREDPGSPKQPI